jgi:hypothetical protein
MRALVLSACTVVIGCTHPVAPPPPAPTAPACVGALAHAPELISDKPDQRDRLRTLLVGHCEVDAWSADARTCIAAATSHDALYQCARAHLTVDQHDKVAQDLMGAVGDHPPQARDAAPARLSITGLEPSTGDADGGTYVLVGGNGFLADGARSAKVYFGTREGMVVRFASDRELIVQAPGGRAGETVDFLAIFEPGGEIKLPHAFKFVERRSTAPSVVDLSSGSQAEIAARSDVKGAQDMAAGRYSDASAKFRDAAARVPEASYFAHLCDSLYHEGKFSEALTACNAASQASPTPALSKQIAKQVQQIKDEAKRQQIKLEP